MPNEIIWRIHLNSAPEKVFSFLTTGGGRKRFWAESAEETDGIINFRFTNGHSYQSRILASNPPFQFKIEYFNSIVKFDIAGDGKGGSDLKMTNYDLQEVDYMENLPGWISVLLALKAALDFDVDIRNHDPGRTWNQGFVDN
jgi:hypothetical protein